MRGPLTGLRRRVRVPAPYQEQGVRIDHSDAVGAIGLTGTRERGGNFAGRGRLEFALGPEVPLRPPDRAVRSIPVEIVMETETPDGSA
jgi:hypothetical protein